MEESKTEYAIMLIDKRMYKEAKEVLGALLKVNTSFIPGVMLHQILMDISPEIYTAGALEDSAKIETHIKSLLKSKRHSDAAEKFINKTEESHPDSSIAIMLSITFLIFTKGNKNMIEKKCRLAIKFGLPLAKATLAEIYLSEGIKHTEAIKLLKEAIREGNAVAALHLGNCYEHSSTISENPNKSIKYYTLAGDLGYPSGYYRAATVAREFEFPPSTVLDLMQMAAKKQHILAIMDIADMHMIGWGGVKKDEKKAAGIYYDMARAGHKIAQSSYAHYLYSIGDYPESEKWYVAAAKQGDHSAFYELYVLNAYKKNPPDIKTADKYIKMIPEVPIYQIFSDSFRTK